MMLYSFVSASCSQLLLLPSPRNGAGNLYPWGLGVLWYLIKEPCGSRAPAVGMSLSLLQLLGFTGWGTSHGFTQRSEQASSLLMDAAAL